MPTMENVLSVFEQRLDVTAHQTVRSIRGIYGDVNRVYAQPEKKLLTVEKKILF